MVARGIHERLSEGVGITDGQTKSRSKHSRLVPPARMGIAEAVITQLRDLYHDVAEPLRQGSTFLSAVPTIAERDDGRNPD